MPRSPEEIQRACNAQAGFLAASCRAYDEGDPWEALRLATIVFTLVHDAGKQHSVLSQLYGVKNEVIWMSTARTIDPDKERGIFRSLRYTPLIEFQKYDQKKHPGRVPEWLPISTWLKLRGQKPFLKELPFEDWWENDVIFLDEEEAAVLTRKKLVLALRNQEGGSHFDPEVTNPHYLPLRKKLAIYSFNHGHGIFFGLELVTMRQIAEELIISLQIHHWRQTMRRRAAA
jgi:hypothetical protein